MTMTRLTTVGSPKGFRSDVARAAGLPAEDVEWVSAPDAARHLLEGASSWPDILVVSPGTEEAEAIELAETAAISSPKTVVVLVRNQIENGLLPAAMRAGIRDVVDLSRGPEELGQAMERAVSWSAIMRSATSDIRPETGHKGTLITVFSSKGGTGKTFLACNLAAAIAARSKSDTALLDVDFSMGDAFTYYGRESSNAIEDILALGTTRDRATILASATELNDNLWGFASPTNPAGEDVPGERLTKLLHSLQATFDYVVVDVPASYSEQVLVALEESDHVCLLASLDVVGIKHLSKALDTLSSIGIPQDKLHIVLNRADSKVGLDPHDVEKVLKITVDSMIPSSRLVPASLNQGHPVYLQEPPSEVAKSIDRLADRLLPGMPKKDEETHPTSALKRLLKR